MTAVAPSAADPGRCKTSLATLIYSIVLLGLGIFSAFMPMMTAFGAGVILGAALLVAGVAGVIAIAADRRTTARIWRALWSLVAIVAGACVLAHPWLGALSLTVALGAGLIAQGVIVAVQGVAHRQRFGRGWSWLLGSGLMMVIFGALALTWSPILGLMLPGLFIALNLITYGAGVMASAFDTRSAAPNPGPADGAAKP